MAHLRGHVLLSRTLLTVALFHERERARLNRFPFQAETQRKGKSEREQRRGAAAPQRNEMNTTS